MRRTFAIGTLAVVFSCAFTGAALAAAAAKVLSSVGLVESRADANAAWSTAGPGTELAEGSEIRTASDGACTLLAGPDGSSALRLTGGSRAVLLQAEPFRLRLESGRVLSLVGRLGKGSSFTVLTPTAIASARGTGWGQDGDSVEVFEDDVDVQTSSGEGGTVGEGSGVSTEGGDLGDPYDLPGDAWDEWNEFKDDVQDDVNGDRQTDLTGGGQSGENDFLEMKDEAGLLGKDDAQTDKMTEEKEDKDTGGQITPPI